MRLEICVMILGETSVSVVSISCFGLEFWFGWLRISRFGLKIWQGFDYFIGHIHRCIATMSAWRLHSDPWSGTRRGYPPRWSVIRDPGGYPGSTTREYPPGDPRWSVIPVDILDPRFLGYPRVDPRWSEIPVDRGWSVNFFENWPIYTENHTYIKLNKFNYLHLILILSHGVSTWKNSWR